MKKFEEAKFNIPALKGISAKTIEEHLKLYAGYVKHANLILEKIAEYGADSEKHAYALGELQRRFGFEFDGMRNHEYYFRSFEGGAKGLDETAGASALKKAVEEEWGSWDGWIARFKAIALTRGIGWAMMYYDPVTKRLLNAWVDEQHLGHLTGLSPVLALDMWEHSFVADYQPSGKKQYVEDFFANLNWQVIEENFKKAAK
ncbi:MAG: Fe-Mn family superoxide dismutase [bacterium]